MVPAATLITTTAQLTACAADWAQESLLAVDTESNSLYVYHERVCLIQISTRTADYIVDPLAVQDISPLVVLFADPAVEIVFHAAEYDLMCLKRDFGFGFTNLFDTLAAARICGETRIGLAYMLEDHYGVAVDKKHQRANWGQRPLSAEMLRYAQLDTHYLPQLRDHWREQLITKGHWEEAQEVFADLEHIPPAEHSFDPEGYWRINGAQYLSPQQTSILRELFLFRERMAEKQNRPPFKIFSDSLLVALAEAAPYAKNDLRAIPGLSPGLLRHYGHGVLEAVKRGLNRKPPRRPAHSYPDPDLRDRYEALKDWRKKRAMMRGVESDVIVPRDALWALARRGPRSPADLADVPGLGPWKIRAYGEEILHVLAGVNGRHE